VPAGAPDWSLGDHDKTAAALTRACLFTDWTDQPLLVIDIHSPPPPPAASDDTAQRSGSGVRTTST